MIKAKKILILIALILLCFIIVFYAAIRIRASRNAKIADSLPVVTPQQCADMAGKMYECSGGGYSCPWGKELIGKGNNYCFVSCCK